MTHFEFVMFCFHYSLWKAKHL